MKNDKSRVAILRAIKILSDNNVKGWSVYFTNSRTVLAVTDYNTKTVELSKRFVSASNIDEFDGVMHHEVAHIIAGYESKHGDKFIEVCNRIYPNELYSCDNYPGNIRRYKYLCKFCGIIYYSNKKEKISCVPCLESGKKPIATEILINRITANAW